MISGQPVNHLERISQLINNISKYKVCINENPYVRVANDERMKSRDEYKSRGERRRDDAETRGRVEPEEQSSEKCRAETRDESREQSAGRDETLSAARDEMQSAGRDESRAPAEMRIVSKQRRKARAKTRAMTAKCSSSCGALRYIERAQLLPWCCTWRVISMSTPTGAVRDAHLAPLALLTRATNARDCIRRALVTKPPTLILNICKF